MFQSVSQSVSDLVGVGQRLTIEAYHEIPLRYQLHQIPEQCLAVAGAVQSQAEQLGRVIQFDQPMPRAYQGLPLRKQIPGKLTDLRPVTHVGREIRLPGVEFQISPEQTLQQVIS